MKSCGLVLLLIAMAGIYGCSPSGNENAQTDAANTEATVEEAANSEPVTTGGVIQVRENCFIVVSKLDLNLRVYEAVDGDTLLVKQYPACLSARKGNKEKKGDMKTPESPLDAPFQITAIQDASTWTHDFGDGRGSILSYGHWFLRLLTPGHTGIGIHGSTNNEESVPGRASEGCIRLLDTDIIDLKEQYAYVGMPVIIKGEEVGLLSFEK